MKKEILAFSVLMLMSVSPAHAISASYRAKLERSGCTQLTEANGTCDVNKSKASNAHKKHPDIRNGKS